MFRETAKKYRELAEVLAAQQDDSVPKRVTLDGLKSRAWHVQDLASSFADKCYYKTAWAIALLALAGGALAVGGKENKLLASGAIMISVATGMRAAKDYRRGKNEIGIQIAGLRRELDETGWSQKLPELKL